MYNVLLVFYLVLHEAMGECIFKFVYGVYGWVCVCFYEEVDGVNVTLGC